MSAQWRNSLLTFGVIEYFEEKMKVVRAFEKEVYFKGSSEMFPGAWRNQRIQTYEEDKG